jgi:hypothetical protein
MVMASMVAEKTAQRRSWDRPQGATFEQWIKSRIARVSERQYDWNALKFQADFDPKYRRAQLRYIGTGGTGVSTDDNSVRAEHFELIDSPGLPTRASMRAGARVLHQDFADEYRDFPPDIELLGALARATGGKVAPSIAEAIKNAVNEMTTNEGRRGYGPSCGRNRCGR